MPRLKRDEHGLYFKADGYVFRPVWPIGYDHLHRNTSMSEGDHVVVRHKSGTPLGTVRSGDHSETWFSHGNYLGPAAKPIVDCWLPDSWNWTNIMPSSSNGEYFPE